MGLAWVLYRKIRVSTVNLSACVYAIQLCRLPVDCQHHHSSSAKMWDLILHYGLFLGGIFQLICILAIVVVPINKHVDDQDDLHRKEETGRKFHGQAPASNSSQIKLRERKKRK